MLKKNINKKIYHSLITIILTVVIFVTIAVIKHKNVSDKWVVKYKLITNEKALIYMTNLDAMMEEFQITVRDDPGLTAFIMNLINDQTEALSLTLNNIGGIKISPDYIFLESKNIKGAADKVATIIEIINKKVKNNLVFKLNLYIEIAEDRVDEEYNFIMTQIDKIALSQNDKLSNQGIDNNEIALSMEDYLNYLKSKLIGANEEITIPNMQEILSQLDENASKDKRNKFLKKLRSTYVFNGIDGNVQLDQLKKRSEELLNEKFLQDAYLVDSKDIKKPLLPKIIIAIILGLVISLIFVYFYLSLSSRSLRKKLTFLLYQSK
jgi:hypothetical protein